MKKKINFKYQYLFGSVDCWNCALDEECWNDPENIGCANRIWKERPVYYAFADLTKKVRIPRKMKKLLKKKLGITAKRVGNRGILKQLYLCGGCGLY